jgi:hypothetical protein
MGLSWQLHVFDLRPVYGDRFWYGRLLRRKSAIPFFGTAARLLALPLNHGATVIPRIGQLRSRYSLGRGRPRAQGRPRG